MRKNIPLHCLQTVATRLVSVRARVGIPKRILGQIKIRTSLRSAVGVGDRFYGRQAQYHPSITETCGVQGGAALQLKGALLTVEGCISVG